MHGSDGIGKTAAMALDPQAQAVIEMIEALGDPPMNEQEPAAARALRASRIRPPTQTIHAQRDVDADGVPARLYRPSDDNDLGLLVYFHGGGWVLGSVAGHENVCRALANRSGHAVLSVDYRLAPESPWPAAVDDAMTATTWAAKHASDLGVDATRLAVGGDSAGGNLAAIVSQQRAVPLRFQLLIYPATDGRVGDDYESLVENVDGPFLTVAAMRWFYDHYLSGGGDRSDPRISPLLADDSTIAELPSAHIITASHDPLRDEGEAYARRLMRHGVQATLTRYQGVFHGFFSFADFIDLSRAAVDEAGDALRRAFR